MTMPYYLWLLPPPSIRDRFAGLIDRLSRQFGTPRFTPHLTLIGSLDSPLEKLVEKTADLAANLAPVAIRLTGPGWTDQHFRCFFMRAERSLELLAAHETACATLGQQAESDYMPHLSLVYGNLPQKQKDKIVETIGTAFSVAFHVDRIGLCYPAGTPEQWQLPHTFALTGRSVT
jgi:2'-5' RNA ligase